MKWTGPISSKEFQQNTICVQQRGVSGMAPVIMINDEVHDLITPDQVPGILEKYLEKSRQEPA